MNTTEATRLYGIASSLAQEFSGKPLADLENAIETVHNIPHEIDTDKGLKPNPSFVGILAMAKGYAKLTGITFGVRGRDATWRNLDGWLDENNYQAVTVEKPVLVKDMTYTVTFTVKAKPEKTPKD